MSIASPFERGLDALGHQYRRQVLLKLIERPPDTGLEGFVPKSYILHAETGSSEAEPPTDGKRFHVHLPKLADYGYITWEKSTGEISRGPNWDEIEPLLDLLRNHSDELPAGWL